MPERATVLSRSEKSAEAVIPGGGAGEAEDRRGRAERVGGPKAMSLGRAVHQKPGEAGRNAGGRGEAEPKAMRDEARTARHETGSPGREDLLGQALAALLPDPMGIDAVHLAISKMANHLTAEWNQTGNVVGINSIT